jgi:hypothetical protein
VGTSQPGPVCSCNIAGTILCEQPFIIHADPVTGDNEPPEETEPHAGYIDPRNESKTGESVDAGVTSIYIFFSQPVFGDSAGGPLQTTNFLVTQTGDSTVPEVIAVERISPNTVSVTLSAPQTTGEWLTLQSAVFNGFGIPILNVGNLGPDLNEPDRIDIGFLPGDVDQNGIVQPLDLLRFRQGLTGGWAPEFGTLELYLDTDRSGEIQAVDLLRFRQLLMGTGNATQPWLGESLMAIRP